MKTGLLLAVDGGNSKTDVAVLRTDGTILGRARGGGFRPQAVGVDAAMEVLAALRAEAMESAGVAADVEVDGITAFLAGADLPYEIKALREAVGARRWAVTRRVDNDSYAVLRAGASRPWGVGVVCGTGINCVGVAPDGRTTGFAALGGISGDWGGGIDVGTSALWHAARAEDGRGPRTALLAAVIDHFGLATVADVTAALHRVTSPPSVSANSARRSSRPATKATRSPPNWSNASRRRSREWRSRSCAASSSPSPRTPKWSWAEACWPPATRLSWTTSTTASGKRCRPSARWCARDHPCSARPWRPWTCIRERTPGRRRGCVRGSGERWLLIRYGRPHLGVRRVRPAGR